MDAINREKKKKQSVAKEKTEKREGYKPEEVKEGGDTMHGPK